MTLSMRHCNTAHTNANLDANLFTDFPRNFVSCFNYKK